mgnify:CR=1 FL=1
MGRVVCEHCQDWFYRGRVVNDHILCWDCWFDLGMVIETAYDSKSIKVDSLDPFSLQMFFDDLIEHFMAGRFDGQAK